MKKQFGYVVSHARNLDYRQQLFLLIAVEGKEDHLLSLPFMIDLTLPAVGEGTVILNAILTGNLAILQLIIGTVPTFSTSLHLKLEFMPYKLLLLNPRPMNGYSTLECPRIFPMTPTRSLLSLFIVAQTTLLWEMVNLSLEAMKDGIYFPPLLIS